MKGLPRPRPPLQDRDSNSLGSNGAWENYFYCQEAVAPYEIIGQKSSFIITSGLAAFVILFFHPFIRKLGIYDTEGF